MKKILLTIMFSWLFVITTLADELAFDVKTLKKEKKELMKQIKKQYGCKKVMLVVSDDGSYYYFLLKGKREYGVADYNGNIIVPIEYDDVIYLPPVEEGVSQIERKDSYGKIVKGEYVKVYHKKTEASFFAKEFLGLFYINRKTGDTISYKDYDKEYCEIVFDYKGDFYNLSGLKVSSTNKRYIETVPGYAILGDYPVRNKNLEFGQLSTFGRDAHMSFFYSDGTPIEEDFIYFLGFKSNDMVKYYKLIDGVEKVGLFNIHNPQESIPCIFCDIKTISGVVHVKQNVLDEFVPYSAELGERGITYLDDGEKFFNQEKWDDVVNYYQTNGIDAPWAGYISAEAIYKKAEKLTKWIIRSLESYKDNPSHTLYKYDDEWHNPRNLEVANEWHKTAYKLNSMYLSGSDTIYLKNACVLQEKLNENIAQFAANKVKYAQILKNTQARIDAQKAQQQQMVLSILSATLDVLSQAASNSQSSYSTSQSSYNKSGTVYKSNNTTTVKQNNAKTQSNSNSQSKSDDDYYEYECKYCDGTGRIVRHSPLHSSSFGLKIDKVTCPECGKTYDKNEYVHKHEICPKCKGKGKFREKL